MALALTVDAKLDGELADLDDTTGLAVYRIVQEALANAARHAAGANATVRVTVADEDVLVEITNGGGGVSAAEAGTGGSGLIGMRERAQSLGGTLEAGPAGRGWTVRGVLPRSNGRVSAGA